MEIIFDTKKPIDSFTSKKNTEAIFDYPLFHFASQYKKSSVLFSKYGRNEFFATESLYLHFVKENKKIQTKAVDGISASFGLETRRKLEFSLKITELVQKRYSSFRTYCLDFFEGTVRGVTPVKMWNMSIASALIFGMFLMTFIYRYLGQGAAAGSNKAKTEIVLGESDTKENEEKDKKKREETADYVTDIMENYQKISGDKEKKQLEEEMKKMVKGYPIEKMVPFIAQEDKTVAAFMIGIAKKESSWGKHVPVLNGEDCYNYWGYRGKRKRMGTGGHTCFDSPEDAVKTVAKRLSFLVSSEKRNTPGKMVEVWKCGYDCSWDNPAAVKKWVSDVDYYFKKFNDLDK